MEIASKSAITPRVVITARAAADTYPTKTIVKNVKRLKTIITIHTQSYQVNFGFVCVTVTTKIKGLPFWIFSYVKNL